MDKTITLIKNIFKKIKADNDENMGAWLSQAEQWTLS